MTNTQQPEVLGVDIGGVVIVRTDDDDDTSFFGDRYLETAAITGVFDALARLTAERFGPNVHFVSKCGAEVEHKTRDWLAHHRMFERTGIPPENLHFCLRRDQKAPIAARLGLTHFVDDRLDVLKYLETVKTRILFDPVEAEVARQRHLLDEVTRVTGWADVTALLL